MTVVLDNASVARSPIIVSSAYTPSPGDTITVTWSYLPEPTGSDWIGLFRGDDMRSALSVGAPKYTSGASNGGTSANGSMSYTIPAGLSPGRYEFRLFHDKSQDVVARSPTIYVASTQYVELRSVQGVPSGAIEMMYHIDSPQSGDYYDIIDLSDNSTGAAAGLSGEATCIRSINIGSSTPTGMYMVALRRADGTIFLRSAAFSVWAGTSAAPATGSVSRVWDYLTRANTYQRASWTISPANTNHYVQVNLVGDSENGYANARALSYLGSSANQGQTDINISSLANGSYEVRLYDAATGHRVSTSAPFQITG